MLGMIDTELKQSGVNPEEFEAWLGQVEKEHEKRTTDLDSKHEQSKQRLFRKWKRY